MPLKYLLNNLNEFLEKYTRGPSERLDNIKLGRLEKPWNTPKSEDGNIKTFFSIDPINMQKGDWYILARTNDLLKPIIRDLKKRGLYFETKQGRSISESLISRYS